MQEERDENNDNSVAASAAFTDASSPHHSTDTDNAQKTGRRNEGVDPREVEEAHFTAQQPSVNANIQGDRLEDLYSRPKKKRWFFK